MLSEWWSKFRFFVTGKTRVEVDEELQFHLEREVEANVGGGDVCGRGEAAGSNDVWKRAACARRVS